MQCDRVREALSARLDGEDPGITDDVVDAHLVRCRDCRRWQEAAATAGRTVRLRAAPLVPDLTAGILDAAPPLRPPALARWLASPWRVGLLCVAVLQLATVVSALSSGGESGHVVHEVHALDLALAGGLATAALRPARAWGMLPMVAAAVVALLVTAALDMADGGVDPVSEATHLLEVVGLVFLWRLARQRPAQERRQRGLRPA